MKVRIISLFFLISIFISGAILPANAVWNGTLNLEDKRAVPILFSPYGNYCASGFLYAPRIVFTVAHNVFIGNDQIVDPKEPRAKLWVGYPGDTLTRNVRRVESEKLIFPQNFKGRDSFRGGNAITRQNDFAIIILKSPLPVDNKKVELLTPEMHQQFIKAGEQINLTGYGSQIAEHQGRECLDRKPSSYFSQVIDKQVNTGNLTWYSTLNTKIAPGMPNTCDGDSGAGYTKILEDKYIYLGAAGSGGWQNHNCASYEPWINLETIMGADPVYLFTDLIREAEKYVADNPYIEPKTKNTGFNNKITITCVKGKSTKKVSGINPKCPAGFKKR